MDEGKFFICECHSEGLYIVVDQDDGDVYISKYQRPSMKDSFISRLKHAINILKTGKPYVDDIVFNKEKAREFGNYLLNITK